MKTKLLMIAALFLCGTLLTSFHPGNLHADLPGATESSLEKNLMTSESLRFDLVEGHLNNYPDPFCGVTIIRYNVLSPSWVRLTVLCPDKEEEILVFKFQYPGTYYITYDACEKDCGCYMATLETYYEIATDEMTKKHSKIDPLPGIE
jgi:hypothetical protein